MKYFAKKDCTVQIKHNEPALALRDGQEFVHAARCSKEQIDFFIKVGVLVCKAESETESDSESSPEGNAEAEPKPKRGRKKSA